MTTSEQKGSRLISKYCQNCYFITSISIFHYGHRLLLLLSLPQQQQPPTLIYTHHPPPNTYTNTPTSLAACAWPSTSTHTAKIDWRLRWHSCWQRVSSASWARIQRKLRVWGQVEHCLKSQSRKEMSPPHHTILLIALPSSSFTSPFSLLLPLNLLAR